MTELKRHFLQGIMNKDLDPHFIPNGQYQHAENIVVNDSQDSNNGAAHNYLGNTLMNSNLGLTNAQCIGSLSYESANLIYWLVAADDYDAIYEFNENLGFTTVVLKSAKVAGVSKLGFNKMYPVTGINYINGLLFWTDNLNPPRRININRCKNYAVDGFTDSDINVIVAPPLSAPSIALTTEGDANNLENKFLYFAYRYKYLDNEYSALSPFSPVAFFPKPYAFDYGVSQNVSMVNSYNTANITFNSGGANVKEIQLVFRDTSSVNTYVVDNLIKSKLGYSNNTDYVFKFKNNKVYTLLSAEQLNRLFDNVPLKAKSQDLIGSRLIYGNYTQFFNLVDSQGLGIQPAFNLTYDSVAITGSGPQPTFKSNRDYEVGIEYLDDYGRLSTVVVPSVPTTNTIFIPPSQANSSNNLKVTIDKDFKAPAFATHYRFVLKQNKQEYYNVFPLTYFKDGQFKWFLINQAEQDKITVGSYLYFKNGSSSTNVQYKVLDIASKSANFLNTPNVIQPAGVYFKIKIDDGVLPPTTYYSDSQVSDSSSTNTPVFDRFSVAEKAIFYGTGLNDMTTGASNAYSGSDDIRFYVQIDGASTFKYYATYKGTYKNLVASNVSITAGSDQVLTYLGFSCSIRFASSTGHTLNDYWVVNCRSTGGYSIFGGSTNESTLYAPTAFFTFNNWSPNLSYNSDRPIKAGGILTLKYKETDNANQWITQTFISTKDYVNIEEWFIEDSIYEKWVQLDGKNQNLGGRNIIFRRGVPSAINPSRIAQGGTISPTSLAYPVYMYFFTYQSKSTGANVNTTFTLQQSDAPSIFETVPTDSNQDIYYELSTTYPIISGNHYGNNQNQVVGTTPAIIDLNKTYTGYPNKDFNAFAWSNGVESFRIRDDWNAARMEFSPRANSTIEGYEEQTLVQALTYSGIYTQTSAINRLNEFNLSLGNFKYLDRFFGSIQKIHARDTNLVVFQENKVSKVLYGKNLLSDSVGGGQIASIPEVLGTQISYVGEYGISLNPESFAKWGNDLFFADARRGAVIRLAEDGLFEISSNGMKNWFKTHLDQEHQKIGMIDPYYEQYVLFINNSQAIKECIFNVSPTTITPTFSGGVYSFQITANSEWYIDAPSVNWITLDKRFGTGNATIKITVANNTVTSTRSTVITLKSCSGTKTVTVTQDAFVAADWYQLVSCSGGANQNSINYTPGTFALNDRVTSGGNTYTIGGIINYNPGGALLSITGTGLTGCPGGTLTTYYELSQCGGTGYAYTTINPGGIGRRFVLPYPTETFYTSTGASVTQTSPPPSYNGSIQITSFYSCP